MKHKLLIYVFILAGLTSCFREDDPVPGYQSPAGVTTSVAGMGPLYETQWYFDLGTDTFVRVVNRESWDLAFQCGADEYHIYVNGSKGMNVANTGSTDFAAVTSGAGYTYRYDRSEGWVDSTAVGEWGTNNGGTVTSANYVYVVDRGTNTQGGSLGRKKMQVLGLTGNTYQVRIANLDGSSDQVISVPKDPGKNFVHLSLNGSPQVVDVEPDRLDWDILFTQYTTLVPDANQVLYIYSVNGVLINPYNVRVAVETVKPFTEILYTDLSSYTFSDDWDAIGYEWKYYDFNTSAYMIVSGLTFIIQSTEGDYYKLRFTSFTNDLGEKGYPTFEVAKF